LEIFSEIKKNIKIKKLKTKQKITK